MFRLCGRHDRAERPDSILSGWPTIYGNPFPVDIKKNRGRKVNLSKGADLRLRFGVQIHDNPKRDDYDPAVAYHTYLKTL